MKAMKHDPAGCPETFHAVDGLSPGKIHGADRNDMRDNFISIAPLATSLSRSPHHRALTIQRPSTLVASFIPYQKSSPRLFEHICRRF
jgi:hypothetical protein